MTAPVPTAPVTLRTFLFDTGTGVDTDEVIGRVLGDHHVARSALRGIRVLPATALQAIDREVGTVLGDLLDPRLGEILTSCWRKHQALTQAANRTLASPGTEEVVALATHRATATYSPHIDLFVDDRKVRTFAFQLTVVLETDGLAAVVRLGDLVGLQGGDCLATATLTLDGAQLAGRQAHLDPAFMVHLERGIPLVLRSAVQIPEQGPTGRGTGSPAAP